MTRVPMIFLSVCLFFASLFMPMGSVKILRGTQGGVAAAPCFPQEKDLVDDAIGGLRLLSDGFRGMLAGEIALLAAACWLFATIACVVDDARGGKTLRFARISSAIAFSSAVFVPVLAGWDVVRYGFWVWLGGFVAANRGRFVLSSKTTEPCKVCETHRRRTQCG